MYVDGTECAGASTPASHNSFPVFDSNARNFPSTVAPMKTRPPAVAIAPPMLGVPAPFTPLASSSGKLPSGAFHATSPVAALTAYNSPHGGFWHGHVVSGFQNRKRDGSPVPNGAVLVSPPPTPAPAPSSSPRPPPRPARPPPPFSRYPHWPVFITLAKT